MGTKGAWTPERRARQAEIIAKTKPWEKSTGPRTPEGKSTSSQNARMPEVLRELRERRAEIMSAAFAMFGRQPRSQRGRRVE